MLLIGSLSIFVILRFLCIFYLECLQNKVVNYVPKFDFNFDEFDEWLFVQVFPTNILPLMLL